MSRRNPKLQRAPAERPDIQLLVSAREFLRILEIIELVMAQDIRCSVVLQLHQHVIRKDFSSQTHIPIKLVILCLGKINRGARPGVVVAAVFAVRVGGFGRVGKGAVARRRRQASVGAGVDAAVDGGVLGLDEATRCGETSDDGGLVGCPLFVKYLYDLDDAHSVSSAGSSRG
jgi:hypothetical protein